MSVEQIRKGNNRKVAAATVFGLVCVGLYVWLMLAAAEERGAKRERQEAAQREMMADLKEIRETQQEMWRRTDQFVAQVKRVTGAGSGGEGGER